MWLIADGLPEHDICLQFDLAMRARNWAATVAEDEHQAYCEDRARSGGPRPGDVLELTHPDGRTVGGLRRTLPEGSDQHWVVVAGGADDGTYLDPSTAETMQVIGSPRTSRHRRRTGNRSPTTSPGTAQHAEPAAAR